MTGRLRLLVTGAKGQLGADLLAAAGRAGAPVTGLGSADLDITDADAVRAALAEFGAGGERGDRGIVINAAAYTAVDAAETDRETAFAVNAAGPANLAMAAVAAGTGLIHVSTDYVFPGEFPAGTQPRPYEVDDPTGPRSVYGASKLAGEQAVLEVFPAADVVRTAWVYGAGGANFVKTMAALEASRDVVDVVDDQVGSPTWSRDLAAGLVALAALAAGRSAEAPGGVLHATGGGWTSWFGFARAIFEELGADPERVRPTSSAAFRRPAPRPAYSVLSDRSWLEAGLSPLPDWRSALSAAFRDHRSSFLPA